MRIYTKSGDKGTTGLIGAARVSKSDCRIFAIGAVDELNALLGILRTQKIEKKTDELLNSIQNDLFEIGALLADSQNTTRRHTRLAQSNFSEKNTHALEKYIDELEEKLPPLKNFILPGGTPFSAQTHFARSVCRRAERQIVVLQEKIAHEKNQLNPQILIYLNRLSDLLFVLAREDMYLHKKTETKWQAQR